ncbi:MAG: PTS sugar transporter subunit IIA [Mitsuokella sp.]
MFGIIVGTHGLFAEELLKSCEMICGEQKNVRAVTLIPGEGPDDVVAKYEKAVKELDCAGGVLFLNDLFGGSPYNAACRLVIGNENYGIVTGVNLPMLVEMCGTQLMDDGSQGIQELMEKAAEAGRNGTHTFHASQISDDDEEGL